MTFIMQSFLVELGTLFYIVDPKRLAIEDVKLTPKFIVPAVPYFLLLMFVEIGKNFIFFDKVLILSTSIPKKKIRYPRYYMLYQFRRNSTFI